MSALDAQSQVVAQPLPSNNEAAIAEAVEMAQLPEQHNMVTPSSHVDAIPEQHNTITQPSHIEGSDTAAGASSEPQRAQILRSETADIFLGPDGAAPSTDATDSAEPILRISLMLITGARHPYTISSRYLASRKVVAVDAAGNFDPREMSAYKLKELIWTDWRQEWEPKPRDPAAIRLIILGRMLEDNSQLKDLPFSLEQTNVVHMTIKPADLLDDDAEGAGKTGAKSVRGRRIDEGESAGCCRCVLQ